jgi:hypothetical protein
LIGGLFTGQELGEDGEHGKHGDSFLFRGWG